MGGAGSRICLDLNSPEFQDVFFRLEAAELKQVVASLRRLTELDWNGLYRHAGFQWEAVRHIKAPTAPARTRSGSVRRSERWRTATARFSDCCRCIPTTILHTNG